MNTPLITVTGADERTAGQDLQRLVDMAPCVEIGLLYSETPEGRNRYPSIEWLATATRVLGQRCAVHVCGRAARQRAYSGRDWIARAGRVQINGVVSREELERFCGIYRYVITQCANGKNDSEAILKFRPANHQVLVDASGGRGRLPVTWERPCTEKAVGFAGGLGPDNLAAELQRIRQVARGEWWVDMEGKLRESDWFSVALAERAIRICLAGQEGGAV